MRTCSIKSLDDDCLEKIFGKLDNNSYDLASVSLVCKRFLLITNRAKVTLIVSGRTVHLLPNYLQRFRNVKNIEFHLRSQQDPDHLITQISQSGLQHLEALRFLERSIFSPNGKYPGECFRELGVKMKGMKKLDFSAICSMCDDNLIVLKDFFPCLEELNIKGVFPKTRYPQVTDDGIEALSSKLKRLKKITLSFLGKVTDKSLMSLSSNCVNLMDVRVHFVPLVTENGIAFLLRHSPKLICLSLNIQRPSFWKKDGEYTFKKSISYANNLELLELDGLTVSDEVLYAIAKASLPLKMFHYPVSQQTNINPLLMLLKSCPLLQEFSIQATCHVTVANTNSLLESIYMSLIGGPSEYTNEELHRNYRMKRLTLSHCKLNDLALVRFGLIYPNLEFLDVSWGNKEITDKGVAELLSVCPKLKHLDVSGLSVSNFVDQPKEENKLKLTCVFANDTSLNDDALEIMGTRCPDLEKLYIQRCKNVTNNGVKMLMSKCEKLKEINMIGCRNLSFVLWGWIMNLRPMLKVGVDFLPVEELKKLVLFESCMVLRESY